MDLERKRRTRTVFMKALYEQTDGDETDVFEPEDFLALGYLDDVDEHELMVAIQYLEGEGLLSAAWTMDELPQVTITHAGVVEVEAGEANPDRPTEHFVPLTTINQAIFMSSVTGAQVQVGAVRSQQSRSISPQLAEE